MTLPPREQTNTAGMGFETLRQPAGRLTEDLTFLTKEKGYLRLEICKLFIAYEQYQERMLSSSYETAAHLDLQMLHDAGYWICKC